MGSYRGLNRKGCVLTMTKEQLKEIWQWSDQFFVAYTDDPVELCNKAWGMSNNEAMRLYPHGKYTDGGVND